VGIVCLSIAFVAGRISTVHKTDSQVNVHATQEPARDKNTQKVVEPQTQGYFSSSGSDPNTRYFHFPGSDSVGRLYDPSGGVSFLRKQNDRFPASGADAVGDLTVKYFRPLSLRLNDEGCKHPEFLQHFRADEIERLEIVDVVGDADVRDDTLKFAIGLKSLVHLDVRYSSLTDGCLIYVDQFPKLTDLVVSQTYVTGDGLAKLRRLKQLVRLKANGIKNGGKLVAALAGSTTLVQLEVSQTGLTDRDLSKIAQLPSLQALALNKNPGITDSGLAALTKEKKLGELCVQGCSLTPDSVRFLRLMPLNKLSIDDWTYLQKAALKKALPPEVIYSFTTR
jgi:hypothetical protein